MQHAGRTNLPQVNMAHMASTLSAALPGPFTEPTYDEKLLFSLHFWVHWTKFVEEIADWTFKVEEVNLRDICLKAGLLSCPSEEEGRVMVSKQWCCHLRRNASDRLASARLYLRHRSRPRVPMRVLPASRKSLCLCFAPDAGKTTTPLPGKSSLMLIRRWQPLPKR